MFTIAAAAVFGVLTPAGAAEVIEIRGGYRVEGDVLKSDDRFLFVDIGVDVVRVPLDRVLSRTRDGADDVSEDKSEGLYTAKRLSPAPVNTLASKNGSGVVLVQTPVGLGSGFLIDEKGHCVTNCHVIEGERQLACILYVPSETGGLTRRRIADVEIVALNPFLDLALLRIPETEGVPFRPVTLAPESDYDEGDRVFAIGNPLGLERSVSQGIVGNRNRNMRGLVYIQTTTQINPGNSGGPLFNDRGEVIGVTNMKLTFGEGLGFAIPVEYLKTFLDNGRAFAFDATNPNTGYRYLEPPRRREFSAPPRESGPRTAEG
ncbi:MAG: trypsin-like peptidase domain-containing protein [Planctomycetota bacterium]